MPSGQQTRTENRLKIDPKKMEDTVGESQESKAARAVEEIADRLENAKK